VYQDWLSRSLGQDGTTRQVHVLARLGLQDRTGRRRNISRPFVISLEIPKS
jgi:hypothetical protein